MPKFASIIDFLW
ncbi:hypothetical protein CP02DC22_1200A, partial [Chlamydia psittaci 02DC22]